MRRVFIGAAALLCLSATAFAADEKPKLVSGVDRQPLIESTQRLIEALKYVGAPLPDADIKTLEAAFGDVKADVETVVQKTLDPHCLVMVGINPESRVKVEEGPAAKELTQHGWRSFLVKVHNEAGINPELKAESPNSQAMYMYGKFLRTRPEQDKLVTPAESLQRFLDLAMFNGQPLRQRLSGLELEYRIVQLYSRDAGKREAQLAFNVGQGTQDLGFRNSVPILFNCLPAVEVKLGVKDHDGKPTTAAFVVRDGKGRVYPNPSRRLAPDFFFHSQVYRADGETLKLPPGQFNITVTRGPEYLPQTMSLTVAADQPQSLDVSLKRWIHPASRGWFSGDHHVHAAGCAHYDAPTLGVTPADMMRHIVGEDLNVGCVLSWGPCWYTQKQNFEGATHALSKPNYLMRYDVEVSGFPSSHCGHLCLLRLKEDDYPGTTEIEQWPSWTLPVLKWAKDQGAVVGYSHSGSGLALPDYDANGNRMKTPTAFFNANAPKGRAADTLPDYAMPNFDGIGANEYIVTVALGVCDFMSTVDTQAIWELNLWYHTLNCGMTGRISGETDFPCIYGERVGIGRVYAKVDPGKPLDYDSWINSVRDGRSYCGDGMSHVIDFKVDNVAVGEPGNVAVGEPGSGGKISQLDLDAAKKVKVSFQASAFLQAQPTPETEKIRATRLDEKPYWHIERCRMGATRSVPVEIIVNGHVAAKKELLADGSLTPMEFDVEIPDSSWVAVRILPSVHTNPVFVHVAGKPIRASRKSAEWCRDAVDVCWNSKKPRIRAADLPAAEAAYKQAKEIYAAMVGEATGE